VIQQSALRHGRRQLVSFIAVIPAKAGIPGLPKRILDDRHSSLKSDSHFRGNDVAKILDALPSDSRLTSVAVEERFAGMTLQDFRMRCRPLRTRTPVFSKESVS